MVLSQTWSGIEVHPADALVYRIDADDRITFVNPAWRAGAVEQQAAELLPERVLGRRLWDYFTDDAVCDLYAQIVARVRSGHRVMFDYRCDTAEKRRVFSLSIGLTAQNEVEFVSRPVGEEARPPVALLETGQPRDPARELCMCSWCQRVELPVNFWLPIEAAADVSQMMMTDCLPRLRAVVCPDCQTRLGVQLEG